MTGLFTAEQVTMLRRSLCVYTNVHMGDYLEGLMHNLRIGLEGTEPVESLTSEEVELAIKAVRHHIEEASSADLFNGYFEASMIALAEHLSSLYDRSAVVMSTIS